MTDLFKHTINNIPKTVQNVMSVYIQAQLRSDKVEII